MSGVSRSPSSTGCPATGAGRRRADHGRRAAKQEPGIGARRAVLRRPRRCLRHLVAALSQSPLTHRLSSLITSDQAVSDLRRHFGTSLLQEAAPFTGSRFEHLAGGGDREPVANVVTADDLIAVETLSVRIPAQAALDLLEGDLGLRLSKLLSGVPFDVDMVEAEAADLAEGAPAHTAWRVLCDEPGIGWVTAGKLLARKAAAAAARLRSGRSLHPRTAEVILAQPAWRTARRQPCAAPRTDGPTAGRRPPRDGQCASGLRRSALDASPYGSSEEKLHRDLTPSDPTGASARGMRLASCSRRNSP